MKKSKFTCSSKSLNILAFVLVVLYIPISLIYTCNYYASYNYYEQLFAQMLKESTDYNTLLAHEDSQSSEGVPEPTDLPLFSDGAEAVVFAYNNFLNANECQLLLEGNIKIIAKAPVIGDLTINVRTQANKAKFSSGELVFEMLQYEANNQYNVNETAYNVFKDGKRYQKKGQPYVGTDNKLYGNYGDEQLVELKNSINDPKFYTINSSVINSVSYFKINRHPISKKIVGYEVSVRLNSIKATADLVSLIKEQGKMSSLPVYKELSLSMILDTTGRIVILKASEEYTSSRNQAPFGDIPLHIFYNYTEYYSWDKPTMEMPQF